MIWLYVLIVGPKLLWDRFIRKKRHPHFLKRLGFRLPALPKGTPRIWIHGVSVGEIKAMRPLFLKIRKEVPQATFFVTTTTATGQEEAKRSLPGATYSYLSIDAKGPVSRVLNHVQPDLFLLSESDFWPTLLKQLQRRGVKTVLCSGKLSQKSADRFKRFAFLAKRMFDRFDLLLLQSEEQKERFFPLVSNPSRMIVTGNPKFDLKPEPVSVQRPSDPFIAMTCTHPGEEEILLDALMTGPWKFFLAPRHPERFEEVAKLLKEKNIPFSRWSQSRDLSVKVVLVDAMGQLPICYSMSSLAILGGSFVPCIGGHNILEPCLYRVPVFFGPHMFGQNELVHKVLEAKAGLQMPFCDLKKSVDDFFKNPEKWTPAIEKLIQNQGAVTEAMWQMLVQNVRIC